MEQRKDSPLEKRLERREMEILFLLQEKANMQLLIDELLTENHILKQQRFSTVTHESAEDPDPKREPTRSTIYFVNPIVGSLDGLDEEPAEGRSIEEPMGEETSGIDSQETETEVVEGSSSSLPPFPPKQTQQQPCDVGKNEEKEDAFDRGEGQDKDRSVSGSIHLEDGKKLEGEKQDEGDDSEKNEFQEKDSSSTLPVDAGIPVIRPSEDPHDARYEIETPSSPSTPAVGEEASRGDIAEKSPSIGSSEGDHDGDLALKPDWGEGKGSMEHQETGVSSRAKSVSPQRRRQNLSSGSKDPRPTLKSVQLSRPPKRFSTESMRPTRTDMDDVGKKETNADGTHASVSRLRGMFEASKPSPTLPPKTPGSHERRSVTFSKSMKERMEAVGKILERNPDEVIKHFSAPTQRRAGVFSPVDSPDRQGEFHETFLGQVSNKTGSITFVVLQGNFVQEKADGVILTVSSGLQALGIGAKSFYQASKKSFQDEISGVISLQGRYFHGQAVRISGSPSVKVNHVFLAVGPDEYLNDRDGSIGRDEALRTALQECIRWRIARLIIGPLSNGFFGVPDMMWAPQAERMLEVLLEFMEMNATGEVLSEIIFIEPSEVSAKFVLSHLQQCHSRIKYIEKREEGIPKRVGHSRIHSLSVMESGGVRVPRVDINSLPQEDFYDLKWAEYKPYEEEEDNEENIEYQERPDVDPSDPQGGTDSARPKQIRYATLHKLIEFLTHHQEFDNEFLYAFLLTYRSFSTPRELFGFLVGRYNLRPKKGESFKEFLTQKLVRIRLRVIQVMKEWTSRHAYDFKDDENLKDDVVEFAKMAIRTHVAAGQQILASVKRMEERMREEEAIMRFLSVTEADKQAEECIDTSKSLLDSFSAEEFARELSLWEMDIFREIRPQECMDQAWTKKHKHERAIHVVRMTKWFNQLSRWVATQIVSQDDIKERQKIMRKMICIAEECKKLNNFNAVFEIVGGLNNAAVHRLKKTKEGLGTKLVATLDQLEELIAPTGSFKAMRHALRTLNPPCIPYLGTFLSDITFIDDGNPKMLKSKINFVKCRKLAAVIRDIQVYQQTPYLMRHIPRIREAFIRGLENMDDDKLYERSLVVEPREPRPAM